MPAAGEVYLLIQQPGQSLWEARPGAMGPSRLANGHTLNTEHLNPS